MCARFTYLTYDEVADVIREMRLSSPLTVLPDWPLVRRDAYPASAVTLIRRAEGAESWTDGLPALEPATLTWGYEVSWQKQPVFNTRIVVAHRLSTIKTCDRIVLLEGGGIAEDGTYDELIAARGKFYDLVRRQQLEDE